MKTWFITGAARGLGLEIARAALDTGDQVIATARDPDHILLALPSYGDRLHVVRLDVTHDTTEGIAADAARYFGGVDVLVNNAGYGQLGAFEEVTRQSVEKQFATNVFGVFDVTRAILPIMRRQRSGRILTIASIAGIEGFEGSSIYCATKHALSGWSEGVAKEVATFGIQMTCVYPGRFRTDFLDGSSVRYGEIVIEDYAASSDAHRRALDDNNHLQQGDPVKFAQAILKLVMSSQPPLQFGAGSDAYAVFRKKAAELQETAEQWKSLMLSTDFQE
ncbi:SDR family NAD(P)-dependent oxidoreductase [Robbsia andropogonis]|uniref:SDR family NAD(P)-dependent oxidoreductase n=1 Tax=Robbsia andropogonis TaxID=28092 RepID=UPI000465ADDD|nr:SDR family NAD(P)-dependent oxidoreductase [Robbsia andropogonis]MCP1120850.1 SDR family NAD(P)-dependent oxidoreductase [Robbsia andropogonis]MCP1130643.1 SDR family NAD(P)-dependent oxidoreductase [Robbsia andropogonis]